MKNNRIDRIRLPDIVAQKGLGHSRPMKKHQHAVRPWVLEFELDWPIEARLRAERRLAESSKS